jgi:ankyrin repeat protein
MAVEASQPLATAWHVSGITQQGVEMIKAPIADEVAELFTAIKECDSAAVSELLAAGVSANAIQKQSYALAAAIESGDPFIVQFLLDAGANLNKGWRSKAADSLVTPLNIACNLGKRTIIDLLLARGANSQMTSNSGRTAAYYLLSRAGSDPTMLMSRFVEKTLRGMLEMGLSAHSSDTNNESLLHAALSAKASAAVIQMLLEAGADPNQVSSVGNAPIHVAARNERAEAVRLLINAGVNIDTPDEWGRTPLFLYHKQETGAAILEHGPDLDHQDQRGETALHRRLQYAVGHFQCPHVLALLSSGANPHLPDKGGMLPKDLVAQRRLTWCEPLLAAASARAAMKSAAKARPGAHL